MLVAYQLSSRLKRSEVEGTVFPREDVSSRAKSRNLRSPARPGSLASTATLQASSRGDTLKAMPLSAYSFRAATPADAEVIAQHRANMFRDMGSVSELEADQIYQASIPWLEQLLFEQSYIGWLAICSGKIVAGGGMHLREIGPVPGASAGGKWGHIANVYTQTAYRRRGLARNLVARIIASARTQNLVRVTLSASEEARSLYQSLGFGPTCDMELVKRVASAS